MSSGSKNAKLLSDFMMYCSENPDQRFWQALRNWAKLDYVLAADDELETGEIINKRDTFYWENKND